jgi:hypothetical protein
MSLILGVSFIGMLKNMKCINNPSLLAGFNSVFMDGVVAGPTKRSKVLVKAKPLADPSGLVVDVCRLGLLASLAYRVESQVGIANLCILFVLTLAFSGCVPQPAFTLQGDSSF